MPTRTARTAWNGTLQQGSGQVELTSSGVGTYDVSFPKRVAEEAGGTTTDATGSAFSTRQGAIIASNGRVHAQMVDVVRSRNRTK